MKKTLKLVIVGSIDHGKSTLIGRLLYDSGSLPKEKIEEIEKTCKMLGRDLEFAYLIDHLQEEREKEMTIDTSQSFFKSEIREYVIIDAPGHKEFIQNMITGASQADAAVLIVDGTEGAVEQTKRHAYILKLLNLKNIIIAVNKMDGLNYDEKKFNAIKKDVFEFFGRIGLKARTIIPISAKDGDNVVKKSAKIPWFLGNTILTELDTIDLRKDKTNNALCFPIQDIYEIDGQKIAVGKIESGELKDDENLMSLPDNKRLRIKKIIKFEREKIANFKCAHAGYNIGVMFKNSELSRGKIICDKSANSLNANNNVKANVFWFDQMNNYKIGDIITIKCATQEINGKIGKIEKRINSSTLELLEENAKELKHTEVGEVMINLKKPLVFKDFDVTPELGRFVLVQNQNVVAGGIIKN